jgi:hypothetical protein
VTLIGLIWDRIGKNTGCSECGHLLHNVETYGRSGQATEDNVIRRMRFACWVTKATDTQSEYIILTATMVT